MGKKLASGSKNIVLDVKCGSGAFLKTPAEARALAECMVKIGSLSHRRASAVITNMDIPLGYAIGNILEVKEAINTLRGKGPQDLREICVRLAAEMASLALEKPIEEMIKKAELALDSGEAYEKFRSWIAAQGGDASVIDDPDSFDAATVSREIKAEKDSYISGMDAEKIGLSAMKLGAGRKTKEDAIDYAAGIILSKKTGDAVRRGEVIATLYTNDKSTVADAEETFLSSLTLSDTPIQSSGLIYGVIR
jgi:thymidine phosphorylase